MISWIKGEIVCSWLDNQKLYILINCHGIGYEIQTLKDVKNNLENKNITLWVNHIKKEDSDNLYGFFTKDERDFFRDLLKIKGIGPQIGMSILNKYSLNEIIDSLISNDDKLISSVPGIGKKMTERIYFELKSKFVQNKKNINISNNENFKRNEEIDLIVNDIKMALKSLNYSGQEIKIATEKLYKKINEGYSSGVKDTQNITFEKLLKDALELLNRNDSKFA